MFCLYFILRGKGSASLCFSFLCSEATPRRKPSPSAQAELHPESVKAIVDQVVAQLKSGSDVSPPNSVADEQQLSEFSDVVDSAITDCRNDSMSDQLGQLSPDVAFTGIPLGATLKPSIKSLIWEGKYVDFDTLFDSSNEPCTIKVLNQSATASQFAIVQKSTKKITTFDSYSAF